MMKIHFFDSVSLPKKLLAAVVFFALSLPTAKSQVENSLMVGNSVIDIQTCINHLRQSAGQQVPTFKFTIQALDKRPGTPKSKVIRQYKLANLIQAALDGKTDSGLINGLRGHLRDKKDSKMSVTDISNSILTAVENGFICVNSGSGYEITNAVKERVLLHKSWIYADNFNSAVTAFLFPNGSDAHIVDSQPIHNPLFMDHGVCH